MSREFVEVVRIREVELLLLVAGLTAFVLRCYPRAVEVPGRIGDVRWSLAPISPVVVGGLLPWVIGPTVQHLRWAAGWPTRHSRLAMVLIAVVTCHVGAVVGVGAVRCDDLRNAAFVAGLALWTRSLASPAASSAFVVGVGGMMWLIGAPSPGGLPSQWAVLLAPGSSVFSATVAGAMLVGGASTFMLSRSVPAVSGTDAQPRATQPPHLLFDA